MDTPILPLEILAHLITFVSSPADLLSISLANHMLAAFAAPELDYRSIRCLLGKDALWHHLIAHPTLASRVRKLEIMRENPSKHVRLDMNERVPKIISDESESGEEDLDDSLKDVEWSEKLLIKALHVLVNLERFTWDRWAPIINQGKTFPRGWHGEGDERFLKKETYEEDIWTVLKDCSQLRELKVVDLGNHTIQEGFRYQNVHIVYESTIFMIENLTHVDLTIYYAPSDEDVVVAGGDIGYANVPPRRLDISPLRAFLLRCLNLQHLNLKIRDRHAYVRYRESPFTDLTSLFTSASWPYLSTLCLCDIVISNTVATRFLAIHPSLRILTVRLSFGSLYPLPVPLPIPFSLDLDILDAAKTSRGFLPELEEVDLPSELMRVVLNALPNLARVRVVHDLEECDLVCRSDDLGSDEEIVPKVDVDAEMNLVQRLTGLRDLTMCDVRGSILLRDLVDAAPQLEILHLEPRPSLEPDERSDLFFDDLLLHLSKLRQLKSFTGIPLWNPDNSGEEEAVYALGEACPLLKEVTWYGGRGVLIRNKKGDVIRVDVVSDEESEEEDEWW